MVYIPCTLDSSIKQLITPKPSGKLRFNRSDIVRYSKSVWRLKTIKRDKFDKIHGATFPSELIIPLVYLYCPEPYEYVFDPFLGIGTTLKVCRLTQRHCIGFELNPEYYQYCLNIKQQGDLSYLWNQEKLQMKVYNTDCRNMLQYIQPDSIQCMITSPPYANFIQRSIQDRKTIHKDHWKNSSIRQYSTNEQDFGNLPYSNQCLTDEQLHNHSKTFLGEIKELMEKCLIITKSGGYNIWIVKDHRLPEFNLPYICFHGDIANIGQQVGFLLHEIITLDQCDNRKLRMIGSIKYPYMNQNSSFIIVLRKK